MFTIEQILQIVSGTLVSGSSCVSIKAISTDSRTIDTAQLFIAIKGTKFNGHDYVFAALEKNAAGCIVGYDWLKVYNQKIANQEKPIIAVEDTCVALGKIAQFYREKFSIPVIAVTGSNGKTTTKEMIASLLSLRYSVLKSEGSFNNHIGVPLSLLRLNPSDELAVIEIGMNHKGEIRSLASIARPNIAVITNIGPAHLEFFSGISDIVKAKCELLENLSVGDLAVINADCDQLYTQAKKYSAKVITFGIKNNCDFKASNVVSQRGGIDFMLNNKYTFKLPLLGEHNVYNLLAAIAVADYLHVQMEQIRQQISNFKPIGLRMQPISINGVEVIADCYNANPDSMAAAIGVLSRLKHKKRRIAVIGDMFELGSGSKHFHSELGVLIAHSHIEKLITIGTNAAYAAYSAAQSGMSKDDVFSCKTNEDACCLLKKILQPEDVLLFKGSRCMHLEEVIDGLKNKGQKENYTV